MRTSLVLDCTVGGATFDVGLLNAPRCEERAVTVTHARQTVGTALN